MILEAFDADYADLLAGHAPRNLRLPEGPFESTEVLGMLRALAKSIRPDFSPASWLIIEGEEVVGLCSIVKTPAGDSLEIGYGICASRRKRGFASGAVAQVLEWARSDPRLRSVRAETSIDNPASSQVLERNGFRQTGKRIDPEDGPVLCWETAVV